MPVEADYQIADDLFKQGKAAMTINGDWTLGSYSELDFEIGVCPIPMMVGGENPKPYVAGNFFMVSKAVADDEALQGAVIDFIKYATSTDVQLAQLETLKRLPSNVEALSAPSITEDPLLGGLGRSGSERHPAADQPGDALRVRRHERRCPRQRCQR